MAEQLPRFDKGTRDEQRPRETHADDAATLHALVAGEPCQRGYRTGEDAMRAAVDMLHRDAGMPERIVFADGTDIASLAIRQEYERRKALGLV